MAWRNVASEVPSPRTTSTSGTCGTGWRKCRPITRSERRVRAAISVTESDEVFVARMSSGGQTWSSLWKIEVLQLEVLHHALDDDVRRLEGPEVVHRPDAAEDALFSDSVRRHFAMSLSRAWPISSTLWRASSGVFSRSSTSRPRRRR